MCNAMVHGGVRRISGIGRFRTSEAEAFVDLANLDRLLSLYSSEIDFVSAAPKTGFGRHESAGNLLHGCNQPMPA